jgi:hypothetical protein
MKDAPGVCLDADYFEQDFGHKWNENVSSRKPR